MKIEPNEIEFDCPKCNRPMTGDKALLGEMINCPDCGEPFMPTPRRLDPQTMIQPTPEAVAAAAKPNAEKLAQLVDGMNEYEKITEAAKLNAAQLAQLESRRTRSNLSHAEKIRNEASRFASAAGLSFAIGLSVGIIGLVQAVSPEGGAVGSWFIVAAALIGAALWLYLIAQIIHIRANTEK